MSRQSFFDVFVDQLKDINSAENQILEAFPKLISAAFSQSLKEGFKKHKAETLNQIRRLKTIFQKLNLSPGNVTCNGMRGLIQEADHIIHHNPPSAVEDSALIGIAQKIEHYEIAAYGTLRAFARHLDLDEVADILDEILEEEGDTNQYLTKLAEGSLFTSGINDQAMQESGSERPKGVTTARSTKLNKPKEGSKATPTSKRSTSKPSATRTMAKPAPATKSKQSSAKSTAKPATAKTASASLKITTKTSSPNNAVKPVSATSSTRMRTGKRPTANLKAKKTLTGR